MNRTGDGVTFDSSVICAGDFDGDEDAAAEKGDGAVAGFCLWVGISGNFIIMWGSGEREDMA
jgi:hypothetical protein